LSDLAREVLPSTDGPPGLVIGLLGPTGVGKTDVAVQLARMLGTRIISCDSMQIYAGFSVLTNQPSSEQDERHLHDLVGFVDPERRFSAVEFCECARPLVEGELASHGSAVLAGGSGLYMRAALAPLAVVSTADQERLLRLEERARVEGPESLHAELAGLDPAAASVIDPRNVRRLVRALEAVRTSGRAWSGRADLWSPEYYYPTMMVGLVMDRQALAHRIGDRSERMLRGGAVEEVERYRCERGADVLCGRSAGICSAIGFQEICRYLDGKQDLSQTAEQISAATRGYARRQLTWLRKVRDAVMIDVREKQARQVAEEILDLARGYVHSKETSGR
jgi:tRNA dimethylallyltransferase